jgi:hypothetical protein
MLQSQVKSSGIKAQFVNFPKELGYVLSKLLEFNPKKRWSAEKALRSTYFDDIRVPSNEKPAPQEVFLNIDNLDENVKLTRNQMREILVRES